MCRPQMQQPGLLLQWFVQLLQHPRPVDPAPAEQLQRTLQDHLSESEQPPLQRCRLKLEWG